MAAPASWNDPVDDGELRRDPVRGEETERDRRVEVAAGDVAEVRDHDPDRETVRERDGNDASLARLTIPAPPPMKISVNVPMNSATPRRRMSSVMARDATARFGRTPHRVEATRDRGITGERAEIECPHCRKTFAAERIEGGDAARYHGFKCPHCKLFVPIERAHEASLRSLN